MKGGSLFGQMPAHSNKSEQCFRVPFLTDNIIDDDRHFTATLGVDRNNYPTGVLLSSNEVTVHILDTSEYHITVTLNTSILVYGHWYVADVVVYT